MISKVGEQIYTYTRRDLHLHARRFTLTREEIYTYTRRDLHLHAERFTLTRGEIYTYTRGDLHLHARRFTLTRGEIYTYTRRDLHLHARRFTLTREEIYTYTRRDLHLHARRFTFTRASRFNAAGDFVLARLFVFLDYPLAGRETARSKSFMASFTIHFFSVCTSGCTDLIAGSPESLNIIITDTVTHVIHHFT